MILIGHSIKPTEYTFISGAHWTCGRVSHILGHKSRLTKLRKLNIYYPLGYEEFFESDSSSLLSELWSRDPIWFFEVLIEDKKIFDLIVRLLPITLKLMAEEGESFHSQSFCDAEGCSLRRRSLI